MSTKHSNNGFTIVELLIVIVIIGILAAITIVAYNGVQNRANTSKLQSDLTNAAKQLQVYYVDNSAYPTTFPSNVKASSGVTMSLSSAGTGFCINAELIANPSLRYYYDSATGGGSQAGQCSGAVIAGSETGSKPNLITNTDFSSGWSATFQNWTGRTLTTRAGTAGDPSPTRPVLVVGNTGTGATAWAVVLASTINRAAIISGRTYDISFYVRNTGTFPGGGPSRFGVLDGGGVNISINTGSSTAATSSWQKITGSSTAIHDAYGSNGLYLPLPTGAFGTANWTLEFQDFVLKEQ